MIARLALIMGIGAVGAAGIVALSIMLQPKSPEVIPEPNVALKAADPTQPTTNVSPAMVTRTIASKQAERMPPPPWLITGFMV